MRKEVGVGEVEGELVGEIVEVDCVEERRRKGIEGRRYRGKGVAPIGVIVDGKV